jgi:hypothetical protein
LLRRASSRNKIPAIPLRAFDRSACEDARVDFHRLRSCSPSTEKGNLMSTFQPIAKLSLYPVTAAIWLNEKDGKSWYSTKIERRYKDESGAWRSSDTFYAGDLLLVAKIADQAHSEIEKLKAADRQNHRSEEE